MMRKRTTAYLVVVCLGSGTANALTGAEYLNADQRFSAGFSWGILESEAFVSRVELGQPPNTHIMRCVINSGITSDVFHEAVSTQIRQDASLLTNYAVAAVLQVIAMMCGKP